MILLLSTFLGLASAQDAETRFLNLSYDAGDLDAYVGGSLLTANVGYLEGSAPASVTPGFMAVELAESGTYGASILATSFVDFVADSRRDIVAYGSADSMGVLALADDASNVPVGFNRLQISHVAEGTPDIDIYLPATGATVADDLPFGGADSINVSASGAFTVMLDIDDDSGADWIFDLPDIGSGEHVNLLVTAEAGDLSIVIWSTDGTVQVVPGVFIPKPTVQFVHLSPDMAPLDVYIGFSFSPVFENLSFGMASVPTPVKRGSLGFTLSPAGVPPTSPFGEGTTRLEAETDYTVYAFGEVSNLLYGSVVDEEVVPGSLALRVLHTSLGLGPVAVFVDGVEESPFLRRGQKMKGFYPTGAFQLGVDNTFDGVEDFVFDVPDYGDAMINVFLATDELLELHLFVDQPDGTLLQLDAL